NIWETHQPGQSMDGGITAVLAQRLAAVFRHALTVLRPGEPGRDLGHYVLDVRPHIVDHSEFRMASSDMQLLLFACTLAVRLELERLR
ncbi:MAG: hypothetical protein V3U27_11840, partial [Candidatus Tectomicrobia bacterium]